MTTTTPERVTIDMAPRIAGSPQAMEQLRDGMANAAAELGVSEIVEALRERDDHPAGFAFEREVVDAAIAEIAPAVADMLSEAILRRLPWTWEPER